MSGNEAITLDELYERTIAEYEVAGAVVHRNEFSDNLPQNPLSGIARSFQDLSGDGPSDQVYVYAGDWPQEHVLAFVNTALRFADAKSMGRLVLVSAQPVPEPVVYLFSRQPHSRFALQALAQFGRIAMTPEIVSELASQAKELVERVFQITLVSGADGLSQLDELILGSLRTVEDREADQPGFAPDVALDVVGILAGQIMIDATNQSGDIRAQWVDPGADMPGRGVAIRFARGDAWTLMNPLGKALKEFRNGSGDSLRFLYDGAIAMLRRSS
jgi:hypothetical protein